MKVSVIIPALRPDRRLPELAQALAQTPVEAILVVDDGSGEGWDACFEALKQIPKVHLLRHAVNLGKGAALKAGINYALCAFRGHFGVVTADADGQHQVEDILKVAWRLQAEPDALVLGVRRFGPDVPLRSSLGNRITRSVVRLLVGQRLSDTQTGLRGIPRFLLPHLLKIPSSGYEFELDMLIACKHQSCRLVEEEIRAIYLEGNRSSHFNPLLDSMRIYFTLLRFSTVSILTALLDNAVFTVAFGWTGSVLRAQVAGRTAAVAFNYTAARRAVFLSRQRHLVVFPKYLLLVLASGTLSYGLIGFLSREMALPVIWAKVIAESILFIANFAIQRDFVFTHRQERSGATDWTQYYAATPPTATVSRKYTAAVLLAALKRFAGGCGAIVELGGANSCFLDRILDELRPGIYHVVDNNQYGLDLLRERLAAGSPVVLHNRNVLDPSLDVRADVVFSVGLIEHFGKPDTRKIVLAHFEMLKPGGLALISFPTPTLLYRGARLLCEGLGLWKFPDERPLTREEVAATVGERGRIVYEKMLWPIVFTQRMIVARKEAG